MLNKIKSRLILKNVFDCMRKRMKLKILRHNKKIQNKLNIKLKDFQDYKTLKELNLKFGFDIDDIDTNKIDLSNKVKGNEILEYINDIEFQKLKELDLQNNLISDIKVFENSKMANLEILNLMGNKISDINILEKVKFKELKELDLSGNKIKDKSMISKLKIKNIKLWGY